MQLPLFEIQKNSKAKNTTTFSKNMSLPIHRWYRYSAGFSAEWVEEIIKQCDPENTRIIDPFAGSGTVQLVSDLNGFSSIGLDPHPFVSRIARSKLAWRENVESFGQAALCVLDNAKRKRNMRYSYPKLILDCFSTENLDSLHAIKTSYNEYDFQNESLRDLTWLLLVSLIRPCSKAGTAQWQYVLPKKQKKKVLNPFDGYVLKLNQMTADMKLCQKQSFQDQSGFVYKEDSRNIKSIGEKWGNLVITSPPYANNYDYADAARLEMMFLGEIDGWKDLHEKVRKDLMVSCTQHAVKLGIRDQAYKILEDEKLAPIKEELTEIYEKLTEARMNHGGKKNYNLMAISYFLDISNILIELRRVCDSNNTKMCWVVGDSAPYSVYLPVDEFIGRLAIHAGFEDYHFEKLRDRNTKWKNRKHNVLLKEGRLWING